MPKRYKIIYSPAAVDDMDMGTVLSDEDYLLIKSGRLPSC